GAERLSAGHTTLLHQLAVLRGGVGACPPAGRGPGGPLGLSAHAGPRGVRVPVAGGPRSGRRLHAATEGARRTVVRRRLRRARAARVVWRLPNRFPRGACQSSAGRGRSPVPGG